MTRHEADTNSGGAAFACGCCASTGQDVQVQLSQCVQRDVAGVKATLADAEHYAQVKPDDEKMTAEYQPKHEVISAG